MISQKLLRISAKESYKNLKRLSPIYCSALNKNIQLTQLFLKHIRFSKESREKEEIEKRLLLIPFIKKSLQEGNLTEIRKNNNYTYYRIDSIQKEIPISIILSQKGNGKLSLCSCFISNRKRPVLTSNGNPHSRCSGLSPSNSNPQKENSQVCNQTSQKDLKKIFKIFLKKENLIDKNLLLCISGGIDSRVLFEVALKVVKPQNLFVFHLDHNTRVCSKNDFNFVKNLCIESNITFFGEVLPSSPKLKKGDENEWRKERKKRTENIAKKIKAERVLTAHHASDFCETMIFRLTKGAGLSGLFPFETSTKPFWETSKTEIEAYAQKNKLKWVEDPSNENLNYERNLIRKKVMPHLQKITPNLEKVFLREAKIFKNAQDFIETSLNEIVDFKRKEIELKEFKKLPIVLQQEFLRKIAQKTPSFSEIENCLKWLNHKPSGGSTKTIGETIISLKKGCLKWEF